MSFTRISIGTVAATELAKTKWWENKSAREIAMFQLFTVELCCPLEVLFDSLEISLGRKVLMSDLLDGLDKICTELLGQNAAPTAKEISSLFPAGKIGHMVEVNGLQQKLETNLSQDAEVAIRNMLWPPASKKKRSSRAHSVSNI